MYVTQQDFQFDLYTTSFTTSTHQFDLCSTQENFSSTCTLLLLCLSSKVSFRLIHFASTTKLIIQQNFQFDRTLFLLLLLLKLLRKIFCSTCALLLLFSLITQQNLLFDLYTTATSTIIIQQCFQLDFCASFTTATLITQQKLQFDWYTSFRLFNT